MRFLFCKIHCPPFICFCKPSPSIYKAGPLKLENSPHAPSTAVVSVANASSNDQVPGDSVGVKEESFDVDGKQLQAENRVKKSCLRKERLGSNSEEVEKKKVQWLDLLGKELVEIREFESSEIEDSEYEDQSNRSCLCTIL